MNGASARSVLPAGGSGTFTCARPCPVVPPAAIAHRPSPTWWPCEIYVIGVGAEIDSGELGNIGRAGVILTKDRAEIANAFEQAAARIEAMSQRYYLLGYCSPARAGVHEVTIEAVHDGKSGSLSYEFDAAGFRPDCDPTKPPRFSLKRPKPRVD